MADIERPILEDVEALKKVSSDLKQQQQRIDELRKSIDFSRILFPLNRIFYANDEYGDLQRFVFSVSIKKENDSHTLYILSYEGAKFRKTKEYGHDDLVKLEGSEQYYLSLSTIHKYYFFHCNEIYDLFSENKQWLEVIKKPINNG